MVGCYNNKQT